MKKIKSYTSVWNVEKVFYAISDLTLPFPVTTNQMMWFIISLFVMILFGDMPPFCLIEGELVKYVAFPVGVTWFMSQKTFDGKKPLNFVKSVCSYAVRPKMTYAGKEVKFREEIFDTKITAVRSEKYVPH